MRSKNNRMDRFICFGDETADLTRDSPRTRLHTREVIDTSSSAAQIFEVEAGGPNDRLSKQVVYSRVTTP